MVNPTLRSIRYQPLSFGTKKFYSISPQDDEQEEQRKCNFQGPQNRQKLNSSFLFFFLSLSLFFSLAKRSYITYAFSFAWFINVCSNASCFKHLFILSTLYIRICVCARICIRIWVRMRIRICIIVFFLPGFSHPMVQICELARVLVPQVPTPSEHWHFVVDLNLVAFFS